MAPHCFASPWNISISIIISVGGLLCRLNGLKEKLSHGVPTRIHPGEALLFGPQDKVCTRSTLALVCPEGCAKLHWCASDSVLRVKIQAYPSVAGWLPLEAPETHLGKHTLDYSVALKKLYYKQGLTPAAVCT